MLAPALVGGLRFSIFEGYHFDTYNYLESALTYQRAPYQTLVRYPDQQLLDADLFPFARTNLLLRPAIAIVYGTLANVFPDQGLFIYYDLLAYFHFLAFLSSQPVSPRVNSQETCVCRGIEFCDRRWLLGAVAFGGNRY